MPPVKDNGTAGPPAPSVRVAPSRLSPRSASTASPFALIRRLAGSLSAPGARRLWDRPHAPPHAARDDRV